jgi:hypothetical protein
VKARLGRPSTYRSRRNGLIHTEIDVADWLALQRLVPTTMQRRGTRWLVHWAVETLKKTGLY